MIKEFTDNEIYTKFENNLFFEVIQNVNHNISIEKSNLTQLEMLGVSYLKLEYYSNALTVFKHIKNKYPNYILNDINIATAFRKNNNINAAIKINKSLIKKKIKESATFCNLGVCYSEKKELKKAIEAYKKSIALDIKFDQAYINLATLYRNIKKYPQTEKILKLAIQNCDNKYKFKNLLASFYIDDLNLPQKGEVIFLDIIKNNKADKNTYNNFAIYLSSISKFNEALKFVEKGIYLHPQSSTLHNTKGMIFYRTGNINKAIYSLKKSIMLDPNNLEPKYNLGCAFIRKNINFDLAWKIREERRLKIFPNYQNFTNNIWKGDNAKNLYIWSEQGIGDQILFLNSVHLLSKKIKNILIDLDYRISNLYRNFLKTQKIKNIKISSYKNKPNTLKKIKKLSEKYEHIAIGSIPCHTLNNKQDFKKIKFPYLVLKDNIFKNYEIDNSKINIGLSWKTTNPKEQHRNINLEYLNFLFTNKYCLHNLQFGNIDKEKRFFLNKRVNFKICDNINYFNDFKTLSQLISNLDLVITVQNTVAHLCGALNSDFIAIIENNCRMNWGTKGNTTLWYPSATVIRNDQKNFFKNKKIFQNILKTTIKKKLSKN